MKKQLLCSLALATLFAAPLFVENTSAADSADIAAAIKTINAVGPKGKGHREATAAWKQLAAMEVDHITDILAGVDETNSLAVNWLRSAADAVAGKQLSSGGKLPGAKLEAFIANTKHAPKARRAAYEILLQADPTAEKRLIPGFLNDPSMELRRDAVTQALKNADALLDSGKKQAATEAYAKALDASRDQDQVDEAAKALRDLGQTVDLPSHFGFIMAWHLVGPFDNVDKGGFDVAYPPEKGVSLDAAYKSKTGDNIKWYPHMTDDQYGTVDLNKAMDKHKGAIAYAYAEFISDADRPCEIRLGCINGNKVWLNGQLLTSNHVYHANTYLDQYRGEGRLKKGKNTILIKVAQNEQTESWAQRWQFQLRVCDHLGSAILAKNRAPVKVSLR